MSTALLVTLTVVEIVALVVVLALFVVLITRRLRAVSRALVQVGGGPMGGVIRSIQGDVCLVGAGSAILNTKLNAIAGMLPAMAEKAESMADQKTAGTAGKQTQADSAVPQDPVTRQSY